MQYNINITNSPLENFHKTSHKTSLYSSILSQTCLYFCSAPFVSSWIPRRTFKDDINTDYGIYPETGDDIVMEAVDRNFEYEQQGGEDQAIGRQISYYENWEDEYDKMYEDKAENQENDYDKMYN